MILSSSPRRIASLGLACALASAAGARAQAPAADLSQQVEIRRTTHGVPHIAAQNLKAAAYALAWVQLEDHGPRVAMGLLRSRGEMGRWFGRDSMDGDFLAQRAYRIAVERYPQLDAETRDVYEGFAAGANRYVALHPEEFPAGFAPAFTGYDVAARDVSVASPAQARQVVARLTGGARRDAAGTAGGADAPPAEGDVGVTDPIEEGSNAWAFAPSRTKSGRVLSASSA